MSDPGSTLQSRLQRLQSHFTWDLKKEDLDLKNLSTRLKDHLDLQLGQQGAVARSYSFLAYVRYLQDQREEAMDLLSQSEKTNRECYGEDCEPRLIVTYGDMAWLKYHTGDYTQSQSYCQKVDDILMKYPTGSSTALLPEVYGEKGWTYLKLYNLKAVDCFQQALELQPDDSEWNAGYAIALHRREMVLETLKEGEESPAVKQLHRALEVNPDDGVLLSILALKLLKEKPQEAERLVERALKIGPDNPHVTRYVAKYLRIKDEDERSIELLKRALKRTSQSAFIHHQLFVCYRKKKNAEQSKKPFNKHKVKQWRSLCIQHLEEAIIIKPSFDLAIIELALLYGEDNNLIRADEFFQRGLKSLSETNQSFHQVFHHHYAEFYYYHKKDEVGAITQYTEALKLTPKTWEWKQCVKKLKQIAERRLSDNEDDDEAYALLGLVAKAEGDKKMAMEFYQKALDCKDQELYLSALFELRLGLQ
ncbi:interferon-induced protein with tetratricopeptide repeats 5 isoform X2 [Larimichthys crocea]|uniref:interferon-induced protein with tetratricopeptide repeats 5 isoform X2 n=1 Tax=Larimichthys crocea TaxID=215358 RepID=UPI000901B5C7|nr:interferon-induced protein with tetratricopeptide repeats 5 isoform X2 [Larimichthys crocea]